MSKINRVSRVRFHSLLLGLLLSTTVLADSDYDAVRIVGVVMETMTVAITGGQPDFSIFPEVSVSNQDIGTIAINSNDPDGYRVTLFSDLGELRYVGENEEQAIPYTVSYAGGAPITLSTPYVVETVNNTATAGQVFRTLTLNIDGPDSKGKLSGTYTDIIFIEIAGM
jgi:hypothetical protein